MLDSGVRIAAAFLPVGVPVLVGLVVAVLRRRVLPEVAGPAIVGLFLQLLAVLASTFLVAEARLGLFGVDRESLLAVSSVIGFGVIVLNVLSWTLLLIALFRRLPARSADRTPTGRHALLDDQGEQVIAEEGTTLLPVGAAAAGAGAGIGLGAAAASSTAGEARPAVPFGQAGQAGQAEQEWPDEPAVTDTFAVEPPPEERGPDADGREAEGTDLDREEPPAVTAESLDEAAETEDEAHADVAETPGGPVDADEARDGDEAPAAAETTTLWTAEVEELPADEAPADEAPADATPHHDVEDEPADDEPATEAPAGDTPSDDPASDDPADEESAVTDTLPVAATDPDTSGPGSPGRTPTSAGHPWFDPAGEAEQGATEPTRAGSTEGR